MKAKLKFIKDVYYEKQDGSIYEYIHRKGDVIDYQTWEYPFRDENPQDRDRRGFYVICNGQGNFDWYQEGEEVIAEKDSQ